MSRGHHRVVISALYKLPFTGHWFSRDWQLAGIVQSQSGNPVNIVTSTSTLNGLPNTVRNVVIGPAFHNTDLSAIRNVQMGARGRLQFRADFFDLFNYANFGPAGNIVGSPTFGKITRTRFPTGEAGSSRQIQLGVKVMF